MINFSCKKHFPKLGSSFVIVDFLCSTHNVIKEIQRTKTFINSESYAKKNVFGGHWLQSTVISCMWCSPLLLYVHTFHVCTAKSCDGGTNNYYSMLVFKNLQVWISANSSAAILGKNAISTNRELPIVFAISSANQSFVPCVPTTETPTITYVKCKSKAAKTGSIYLPNISAFVVIILHTQQLCNFMQCMPCTKASRNPSVGPRLKSISTLIWWLSQLHCDSLGGAVPCSISSVIPMWLIKWYLLNGPFWVRVKLQSQPELRSQCHSRASARQLERETFAVKSSTDKNIALV